MSDISHTKTISKTCLAVQTRAFGALLQASIIIYLTSFLLQANHTPIEKGVLVGFHYI